MIKELNRKERPDQKPTIGRDEGQITKSWRTEWTEHASSKRCERHEEHGTQKLEEGAKQEEVTQTKSMDDRDEGSDWPQREVDPVPEVKIETNIATGDEAVLNVSSCRPGWRRNWLRGGTSQLNRIHCNHGKLRRSKNVDWVNKRRPGRSELRHRWEEPRVRRQLRRGMIHADSTRLRFWHNLVIVDM